MTPVALRALELRLAMSKTSVKKLDSILLRAVDALLRNCYLFYGAHTGRWSGKGAQTHNLPRGTMKASDYEKAIEAILANGDLNAFAHEDLGRSWRDAPLDVIASCLRGVFQAPAGQQFNVCDFAQVELRVLAWLAACEEMQDVFRKGGDLYTEFAAHHLYRVALDQVTKRQRQVSKSAVLGCGYQQGAGYMRLDKAGDPEPTGLWGYAAKMGVALTQEESFTGVQAFRNAYKPVVRFWYNTGDAAIAAVENPGEPFYSGPVTFITTAPEAKILFAVLPSGRRLFYLRPELEEGQYGRPQLTYEGLKLNQWVRIRTYGGHLVENLCQAVARDLLAEALIVADERGFNIIGHCHDEIISLDPVTQCDGEGCVMDARQEEFDLDCRCGGRWKPGKRVKELEQIMSTVPVWADGLLLGAEGYESKVYRK